MRPSEKCLLVLLLLLLLRLAYICWTYYSLGHSCTQRVCFASGAAFVLYSVSLVQLHRLQLQWLHGLDRLLVWCACAMHVQLTTQLLFVVC